MFSTKQLKNRSSQLKEHIHYLKTLQDTFGKDFQLEIDDLRKARIELDSSIYKIELCNETLNNKI